MLWKLIFILGCIPCAVYWLARYYFYLKPVRQIGAQDCRLTGEDFAKKISYTGKIPRGLGQKREASALAEIALAAAYEDLRGDHAQPVALRQRADLYAQIIVPFSLMILVFAVLVGKQWAISLACMAVLNGFAAIMKLTSRSIASHAAERATVLIKKARIPRQSDESTIEMCLRALTWK